jgi:hypothetical protein
MASDSSSNTGERSEFEVASDLAAHGYAVSLPFDDYRYDIVGDYEGHLLRIQVKTAHKRENQNAAYEIDVKDYTPDEVDLVAGYVAEQDAVFYESIHEAGSFASVTFTPKTTLSDHNAAKANLPENQTFSAASERFLDED